LIPFTCVHNYDKEASNDEDLSTISKRIYSIEDYHKKQLNQLIKLIDCLLTTNESFYISKIFDLIESDDGQINDLKHHLSLLYIMNLT
jgi:hypothetical protein